ncbi:hypothetical protein ACSBR2_001411 [Camellia fascicularis]
MYHLLLLPQKVRMTAIPSKLYRVMPDDASLLMILLDTNPFFWSTSNATSLSFPRFLLYTVGVLFRATSSTASTSLYWKRKFNHGNSSPNAYSYILCLHGSTDGPGQYVAIMNAIFSAQRQWYRAM